MFLRMGGEIYNRYIMIFLNFENSINTVHFTVDDNINKNKVGIIFIGRMNRIRSV